MCVDTEVIISGFKYIKEKKIEGIGICIKKDEHAYRFGIKTFGVK